MHHYSEKITEVEFDENITSKDDIFKTVENITSKDDIFKTVENISFIPKECEECEAGRNS